MNKQDDGLSSFLPKTLGKKADKDKKPVQQVELEDDEYEVEEPAADAALMAMMPMSFGKQVKKRDLSATFAKSKRVIVTGKGELSFVARDKTGETNAGEGCCESGI
jgi:hypothetical protein